jgi:hypothetical protein
MFSKEEKDFWAKIIEQDDKKIAEIERAIQRVERARDKADRKAEQKALRQFEKIANKEMGLYEKETDRDYW